MQDKLRIGVDLGGTKIAAVLMNAQSTVLATRRVATPQGNYAATVQAIVNIVQDLEAEAGVVCLVGVATPGAIIKATGLMKNCNSVCLNQRPLKADIEKQLMRDIGFANDADCFALSEAKDGAAKGSQNVFAVILGTGVGGAWVANGQLVQGPNAITGEWGHNPFPATVTEQKLISQCYCGQQNCIETWLSGPGWSRWHNDLYHETYATEVIVARSSYDKMAQQSLMLYQERLTRALATVINLLDPEVIVLGGGLSELSCIYAYFKQHINDYVFTDHCQTKLLPAQYGAESGMRGAAFLQP